jgi:hypothetical protein
MSLHAQHGFAAPDLARLDMVERHRTPGRTRIALSSRWEPSRDGDTLSARPGLRLRWRQSATDLAA